jgi:hypothetical protein
MILYREVLVFTLLAVTHEHRKYVRNILLGQCDCICVGGRTDMQMITLSYVLDKRTVILYSACTQYATHIKHQY